MNRQVNTFAFFSRVTKTALFGSLMLFGCATQEAANTPPPATTTVASASPAAPAAPAPITALPHEEAILLAARDLFNKAQLPAGKTYQVVIDPLVDGSTGYRSIATASMEKRVVSLVKSDFPQYEIKPFNSALVHNLPLIMVGTFTPINLQGKADGEKDAYRVCFALADLKTGKIVSKGFARSQTAGVDPTPLPYFNDVPFWVQDKVIEGYVKTCQGSKAGDPIHPAYIDTVVAATTIDEAMQAYDKKNYKDALALFNAVLRNPAGDQPRVHAGLYMVNQKLGKRQAAMQEFDKIVRYGLTGNRLAMRFNFNPGGSAFASDGNPYQQWLKGLAGQAAKLPACLEVAGHADRGGSEQINERLSLQRAEFVKQQIVMERKELAKRVTAQGYGSRQTLIGTGKSDASDALDRRIEFKPLAC
jgi:outer membrane protein OmpA-like peptidoglycan-associated protein